MVGHDCDEERREGEDERFISERSLRYKGDYRRWTKLYTTCSKEDGDAIGNLRDSQEEVYNANHF